MLLILVVVALAVFAMVQLTRSMEPGQRVVSWLVFVLVIGAAIWKLVGLLGRASGRQ